MKKFISILLIITVILSLCACSYTGSNTKITIGVLESVHTLDPVKASSSSEKIVSANCFEGLLRLDEKGNIHLGGAVRYSVSSDSLTYTFKLNESAKYHISSDTKKVLKKVDYTDSVIAKDYIFGIKRYRNENKSGLNNIDTIKATDDFTLVIKLKAPDMDFLYKLATLPIYPCNETIAKTLGSKLFSSASYTPCNGTYYINEYSNSETLLERNSDYSGSVQVSNRFISLYTTGSIETLRKRFEEKTYDLYIAPSTHRLEGSAPTQRNISTVWGLAFNMKSHIGKNDDLRSILLSAVDYQKIDTPLFGVEKAQRIVYGDALIREAKYTDFSPAKLSYTYSIDTGKERLKALTDEIGHTTYTVDFAVPVEMKSSAEAIIEAWNKSYGDAFLITLTTFELTDAHKVASEGKYDIAILPIMSEVNTVSGILTSLGGAPCYADKSKFLKSYNTLPDDKTIAEDFKNAEKYIVESGIFVPLFTASNDTYSVPELTGVYSVDGGEILYLHAGTKPEEK